MTKRWMFRFSLTAGVFFYVFFLKLNIFAGSDTSGPAFYLSEGSAVSVITTGDMMLGASTVIKSRGVDYPFDSVRTLFRNADVAITNLEAPFTKGGTRFPKKYSFKVPGFYIEGPVNAGFDVFTLANNHILDYGLEGLSSTLDVLDSAGVLYSGAGLTRESAWSPAVIERKNKSIAIYAFTLTYPDSFWATSRRGGTAYVTPSQMEVMLKETGKIHDYLIVSFHWGAESMENPKAYQRNYAHRAVKAGADLVIGHHPHVLQGIEIYRGAVIAYSLGNFVFGSYSLRANDSALIWVEFSGTGIRRVQILPIHVRNHVVQFQPRLLAGEDRTRVIDYLNLLSHDLNRGKTVLDSTGLVTF